MNIFFNKHCYIILKRIHVSVEQVSTIRNYNNKHYNEDQGSKFEVQN